MHTSPQASSVSPPSRGIPPGFTLVELLIATVVLVVGLLALTSAGAAIVRLELRGQRFARVAARGESRLELLRSRRWAAAPGISSSHGIGEWWAVTQIAARTLMLVDSIQHAAEGSAAPADVYVFRSAVRC
jgi:prepilin-type N-terminal cleavage/methylation domain-containing protein